MVDQALVFQENMSELRLHYLKQLEQRVHELQQLHRISIQGNLNSEELLSLQFLAHKLSGSGSIFGFKAITEAGRLLEIAIMNVSESNTQKIIPLLEQLITYCKEALLQS